MRSAQFYKYYIYARFCPGQVGRWNLRVARGMLKPAYFTFVKTMLEFFFFANYKFLLNNEHILQDQRAK